jgi:hypothetical protein
VSIFRHAIFSSGLIAVPFIFSISYFLGVGLLFLACLYLAVLFIVGTGCDVMVLMCSGGVVSRF